jgi:hypothetical protein
MKLKLRRITSRVQKSRLILIPDNVLLKKLNIGIHNKRYYLTNNTYPQ